MDGRTEFVRRISKYHTIDSKDPDLATFIRDGSPSALKQYIERLQSRIDVKKRRLERDARFDAVILLANRDDLPRNIWLTHDTIVDFIENDNHPEQVQTAIYEISQDGNMTRRLKDTLVRQLSAQGLVLRQDSQLCWAFVSGACKEPPDRVVAIAKLTSYLWMNGRQAWEKHRIWLENEVARLYECGAAYTWVECVHIAIRNQGFVFC